jgi:hypothetical protein
MPFDENGNYVISPGLQQWANTENARIRATNTQNQLVGVARQMTSAIAKNRVAEIKKENAAYQRQKTKSVSSGMQALISAGLGGSTAPGSMELGYEQEVGVPFREAQAAETARTNLGAIQLFGQAQTAGVTGSGGGGGGGETTTPQLQTGLNIAKSMTGGTNLGGELMPSSAIDDMKIQFASFLPASQEQVAKSKVETPEMLASIAGSKIQPGIIGKSYSTPVAPYQNISSKYKINTYAQWKNANPTGTASEYLKYYNKGK